MSEARSSDLGFLEKLLDGAEVEWRPLGDVAKVERGKRLTKDKLSDEFRFPVFHGGLEPMGFYDQSNRPANSTMIINVGASAGTVGYSDTDFWSSDGCYCISQSETLNSKFLFHFLRGLEHQIIGKVRYAGIPTLDAIVVERLLVPIPCPEEPEKSLAIQGEIVRILDSFTELTAELTAELELRRKQYNHYRDQLLTFKDGEVEHLPLSSFAKIVDGTHQTPKYTDTGVPFVSVENIKCLGDTKKRISVSDFDKFKYKPAIGDIFMTRIGDIGTCALVESDDPLAYYVTLALIRVDNGVALPGYVAHFIQSRFGKLELYKRTLIHAVPIKINLGDIGKLSIPIPCPDDPEKSLSIQGEIVRALNKFDTLTASLSEGLPHEIELRKKQYEYYRDLLLSFPKPAEAIEA